MKKIDKSWGGSWTEQKLQAFEKYVNAYLTIMLKQRETHNEWPQNIIYFDGFAGCGYRNIIQNNNNNDTLTFSELEIDDEEINVYKGSAERVVKLDKKFDEYYFIDVEKDALDKLKNKIEPYFDKNLKYKFLQKDINDALNEFSNYLDKSKAALILLDPFGMQLNWDSLEKLRGKRVDVWILLPSGVIINRLLDKKGNLKNIDRLKSFFGLSEDEIRNEFYNKKIQKTLWDEGETTQKISEPIQQIANLYIKRLKTIWDFVTEEPLKLYNSRNVPIYHFVFASNNEIARKIAGDIINPKK